MHKITMVFAVLSQLIAAAFADGLPPFKMQYEVPTDGQSAVVLDDTDGIRVRNLEAEIPRSAGPATLAWDLKNDLGQYVEPGTYRFRTLVMPRPELYYHHTVYPNVENYSDDRVPWGTGHSSPNGWGSDFDLIYRIATTGDRVYFGARCSEAGEAFTEIDLDGKRQWAYRWFAPWVGLKLLAADEDAVYVVDTQNYLWRMNVDDRRMNKIMPCHTQTRRGVPTAMAARDGKLYLSFAPMRFAPGGAHIPGADLFDNVTHEEIIDHESCLPLYDADPPKERLKPNPRWYFRRLLRLPWDSDQNRQSTPPGMHTNARPHRFEPHWPVFLQTSPGTGARRHIVVAFHQDTPIGSIAFPYPHDPEWIKSVEFSTLKPGAQYPPRPDEEADWVPFAFHGKPGTWNVVPAPEGTVTRALRVSFNRSDALAADAEWLGWLEGMKMLNRRFRNLALQADIRVNSGVVDEFGAWDAQRRLPISRETPGIYLMEWPRARSISGLAIEEIDGAITEIDVWDGPDGVPVGLEGNQHWRNVAVYRQQRRDHYGGGVNHVHNAGARYLDGYVDLRDDAKRPVQTRAIRLRVVEQWLVPGFRGLMGIRKDLGGRELDTRRCRIFGVAALEHLGGEALDEIMYRRLAVYDAASGEQLREFPLALGSQSLHFHPDGRLVSLNATHDKLLAIDTETGATTEVLTFAEPPQQITFGPDGLIYAYTGDTSRPDWVETAYANTGGRRHETLPLRSEGVPPFRVYDLTGRIVKEIGTPGNIEPGPWVPSKISRMNDMTVDRLGRLWVATGDGNPKRIVRFDTRSGEVTGEFLGNTKYGGGGSFNRYDSSSVFSGGVEFEIDSKTKKSRIRNLMAHGMGSNIAAVRLNGRTYLADVPLELGRGPEHISIHLYDEKTGTAKLVAAFGHALHFGPVRRGDILAMLDGKPPLGFSFTWSDINGNGDVDADEIRFEPVDVSPPWSHMGPRSIGLGFIDDQLNCVARNSIYTVTEILPGGVPLYERRELPFESIFRLRNGNYLLLQKKYENERLENCSVDPEGRKIWGYPVHNAGVTGLHLQDYVPGYVTNQYGSIIGHAVPDAGDLGEFVVVNQNTGQWRIWTSDGLLAGEIFQHKFARGVRFPNSFTQSYPGMRLDPLSLNQEHFNGYFAKCEKTGRFFAVAGFTSIGMIEVKGLERARRHAFDVQVTAEDIARAKAWEEAQEKQAALSSSLKMKARNFQAPPTIDGIIQQGEWDQATQIRDGRLLFRVGYDKDSLYLSWAGKEIGKLANSFEDFRTCYTSGSAFDFFLGTNPKAPPDRREPEAGDLRLLITFVGDQPKVVLYQPKAKDAGPEEGWRAYSPAAGELQFDRIVQLADAKVAKHEDGQMAVVEAAIPLKTLGLQISDGLALKMDWGMLVSVDGVAVQQRIYWANQSATGTGDVVAEGRLMPYVWGQLEF